MAAASCSASVAELREEIHVTQTSDASAVVEYSSVSCDVACYSWLTDEEGEVLGQRKPNEGTVATTSQVCVHIPGEGSSEVSACFA